MSVPKNSQDMTNNENVELEKLLDKFEPNMLNGYEELSNKCDVIIKKIKSRKSQTKIL